MTVLAIATYPYKQKAATLNSNQATEVVVGPSSPKEASFKLIHSIVAVLKYVGSNQATTVMPFNAK